MVEKRCGRGANAVVVLKTFLYEALGLPIDDLLQRGGFATLRDFPVYLSCVQAFRVWVLGCHHLKHAHAEGIYVDFLIVELVVQFGGHELGRTKHRLRLSLAFAHKRREAEIANLNLGVVPVDKDVVAFEIAVDDTERGVRVDH